MVRSTAAAILAGGQARRFGGRDKSRLVIGGRSIIVRQLQVLQRVAGEVFVVGRDAGRFADLNLAVYPDRRPGCGVLGGIHTALDVSPAEHVLVVGCDLPFLDEALLTELVRRTAGHDGAWVRSARGVEPLLACYRRDARDRVLAEIDAGRLKVSTLDHVLRMATIEPDELDRFGTAEDLLANINTPADFDRVQYGRR